MRESRDVTIDESMRVVYPRVGISWVLLLPFQMSVGSSQVIRQILFEIVVIIDALHPPYDQPLVRSIII